MKLMVVDDNAQIREGICRGIDWSEYGFEEVKEYADGRCAAAALEAFRPDVIIADICMPGMDGLELLRFVRERLKECKYLLLSAYSEFSYAQKAVRFGADDYILKPVKPGKLIELVVKCREELEQRSRESRAYLQDLEKSFLHSLTIEKRPPDDRKLLRLLEERYGLSLPENLLYVGVASLFIPEQAEKSLRIREAFSSGESLHLREAPLSGESSCFREEIGERLAPDACAIPLSRDKLLLIGRGMRSQAASLEALARLKRKLELINREINGSRETACPGPIACAGISQIHPTRQADEAYAQACEALDMAFYREQGAVLFWGQDREDYKPAVPREDRKRLLAEADGILGKRDTAALLLFFDRLEEWGLRERYEPCGMKSFLAELWRHMVQIGGAEELAEPDWERSFGSLLQRLREDGGVSLRYAAGALEEGVSPVIRGVCEYLNGHYREPVTVESAAALFSRTPNYISAKFKREMGRSFTDYLMEVRIRKAVYLLENTAMPVQSIAEETGFGSYDYFSRVLRKNTGQSAGEIRDKKYRE